MNYRGISHPFRKGPQSFPAKSYDDDLIADSIRRIIMTPPKKRIMRPTLGCGAQRYVFDNNNTLLKAKIRQEVIRALGLGEPRIEVQAVSVTPDDNKVTVTVEYTVNERPGRTAVEIPKGIQ